jgi:hypothetical protein
MKETALLRRTDLAALPKIQAEHQSEQPLGPSLWEHPAQHMLRGVAQKSDTSVDVKLLEQTPASDDVQGCCAASQPRHLAILFSATTSGGVQSL